jgi:hypothetical protein
MTQKLGNGGLRRRSSSAQHVDRSKEEQQDRRRPSRREASPGGTTHKISRTAHKSDRFKRSLHLTCGGSVWSGDSAQKGTTKQSHVRTVSMNS